MGLVAALRLPFVETHISYVLFDRGFAYKIKKPVRFPFLDFTTLAAREYFCREELRLNRRLAPSIYLDVVPITGTVDNPVIEDTPSGRPAIEFAVKMRAFDQDGLLSRVIARDELTSERVDALAAAVAAFHDRTDRASADGPYGSPDRILDDARENFAEITASRIESQDRARLETLRAWTEREGARCTPVFVERKLCGFVRECHGDLHLGNVALVDGAVTLFDCIEFNASMRWIDVMSDVAFLVMDLRDRNRPDLAFRFLSQYLQHTGDYDGLVVLSFYVVYRALVRAKIASVRLGQTSGDERARLLREMQTYLDLAMHETARPRPSIIITHGVSGSGKTVRAQALVDNGAIAVRSDVERKRLGGLGISERSHSAVGGGLYTSDVDQATYTRLAALARSVVLAGYTVVVDAAFLKRWQRDVVRKVAEDLKVPFVIADCSAPESVLRERVARRLEQGRDASEATVDVLAHQLATEERLTSEEQSFVR